MPSERAVICPIRTGMPNALLASISRRGRNSPIRGTIQPWRKPQLAPNNNQNDTTSHSSMRAKSASQRMRPDDSASIFGNKEVRESIGMRIMTVSATVRSTTALNYHEVL